MKKTVYLLYIILSIALANCTKGTIIYGQYKTVPGINLRDYKIQLILSDENYFYEYIFRLSRDGRFRIRTREKGIFIGSFWLNEYPYVPGFRYRPFLSNEGYAYVIDTINNDRILIDQHLYLTEQLIIYAPNTNEVIKQDDDRIIKWQEDIFADYYHILLISINENERVVINVYVKNNFILVKKLFDLINIESDFCNEIFSPPFAVITGKIASGMYYLNINGYKFSNEENRYIYTSVYQRQMIELLVGTNGSGRVQYDKTFIE